MNWSLFKNKIIMMIVLASLFQLITFILSQVLLKIDEDLESKNYKIISNEIKLQDIDMHINHFLPDLLIFSRNQRLNSQLYTKHYKNKNEYDDSFFSTFQNLRFYFNYIKEDFFIETNNNLRAEINNIEKEFKEIKNTTNLKKLKFLEDKLYPVYNQLVALRSKVNKANQDTSLSKEYYKSIRHRINIGLVVTQILNLLFLSLFFFFVFPNSSRFIHEKDSS
jgi:hypothetical protein